MYRLDCPQSAELVSYHHFHTSHQYIYKISITTGPCVISCWCGQCFSFSLMSTILIVDLTIHHNGIVEITDLLLSIQCFCVITQFSEAYGRM